MTLNTITAGIDRSDPSTNALRWAADFAADAGAALRAVHVWQVKVVAFDMEMFGSLPNDEWMKNSADEFLAKQVSDLGLHDAEQAVVQGSAGPVLAKECAPDRLVVVGRTGRGAKLVLSKVMHGLLGSTARHVVHHADGPVAVLPPDAPWTSEPRVLVGVDGTASSLAALAWAIDNLPSAAKITAIRYVIPWINDPLTPVDDSYNPELLAAAEAELRVWVDETVAASSRPDQTVAVTSDIGAASWALAAASRDADLLVVGHRDRSVIASRLLGSVADHAVRHAHTPVIVVPDTAD